MDLQFSSVERAPQRVPLWDQLMDDLGRPRPARLARALGVGRSTIYRWNTTGHAPRLACLAVFWLTRWGRSEIDAQATNDAILAANLARALSEERDALRRQVIELRQTVERLTSLPGVHGTSPMRVDFRMGTWHQGHHAAPAATRPDPTEAPPLHWPTVALPLPELPPLDVPPPPASDHPGTPAAPPPQARSSQSRARPPAPEPPPAAPPEAEGSWPSDVSQVSVRHHSKAPCGLLELRQAHQPPAPVATPEAAAASRPPAAVAQPGPPCRPGRSAASEATGGPERASAVGGATSIKHAGHATAPEAPQASPGPSGCAGSPLRGLNGRFHGASPHTPAPRAPAPECTAGASAFDALTRSVLSLPTPPRRPRP